MSTVRRGDPSSFRVTTILKHQVVGSPCGTCSNTPNSTSRRRSLFTCSCQCNATGAGVRILTGFASGLMWIWSGGPSIVGRIWCGHLLKVDMAKRSRSQCFIFPLFSGTHGRGRESGVGGGSWRFKQPHSARILIDCCGFSTGCWFVT